MDELINKSFWVNLEVDQRIRIAAAQMRISQAEMFRLAVEAYMDLNGLGSTSYLPHPKDAEAIPVIDPNSPSV